MKAFTSPLNHKNNGQSRKILVYISGRDRPVAHIEDGVLRKRVALSKHLHRLTDSWGIQSEIFQHYRFEKIDLEEVEEGKIYSLPRSIFLSLCFERDYGYGAQKFVSRSKWGVQSTGKPVQLKLVG